MKNKKNILLITLTFLLLIGSILYCVSSIDSNAELLSKVKENDSKTSDLDREIKNINNQIDENTEKEKKIGEDNKSNIEQLQNRLTVVKSSIADAEK